MNLNFYFKNVLCLFAIMSITASSLWGQDLDREQLDSLAAAVPTMKDDTVKGMHYQTLGRSFSAFDLDKAYFYGSELEKMSQRINWPNGMAIANNIKGFVNLKTDEPDSAYFFYKKANDINKKSNNLKGYAATNSNLGNVAMYKADYPLALQHYMEGLKTFEAMDERRNMSTLNMNIGLVFGNMKMYPQSKKYLKTALKLYLEDKEDVGAGNVLLNLGSIYQFENKHLDSAKLYLRQAFALASKLDHPVLALSSRINMASIFLKEKNIDSIEAILNSSLIKNADLTGEDIISIAQLKAELSFIKQDYSKAAMEYNLVFLLPADSLAKSVEKNEAVRDLALLISRTYEALGNSAQALDYYKRFHQMADSIDNSDNRQALKNFEFQRELELKDAQIKVSALELQNQKRAQWVGIGLILATAVIGIVFWYQNKQRKKANQRLSVINKELDESNKVKARFFSILSHDLRSPIASLSNYIYLLNEEDNIMEPEVKIARQRKIGTATNNLLSTMEDILLWSKSQMERFEPVKKNVPVAQLFEDVQKLIPQDIDIDISFDHADGLKLHTDENYLTTIMRNLTANAIKALKGKTAAKIEWKAWQQNGKTYLSITDNGPGLSQEQKEKMFNDNAVISTKTGLGIHLVRDLIKMLQHQMDVQSEPGKGTTFTITVL